MLHYDRERIGSMHKGYICIFSDGFAPAETRLQDLPVSDGLNCHNRRLNKASASTARCCVAMSDHLNCPLEKNLIS